MPSVSIIGMGRVGGALALALHNTGYTVEFLVHRGDNTASLVEQKIPGSRLLSASSSLSSITSEIVLITTPDPVIRDVAARLQQEFTEHEPTVLHTSGSLDSTILKGLRERGFPTGSMHPLVSISDAVAGAASFRGAYFCVEGDEIGSEVASSIADALGGRPFSIATRFKALYHAAAVVTSGHAVALLDTSIEMLSRCGIEESQARQILLPLIRTTLGNLESKRPSEALTGSFARADLETISRHLEAIDREAPEARDIYLLLGQRSLDLAESNGVDRDAIAKVRETISIAKRKPE